MANVPTVIIGASVCPIGLAEDLRVINAILNLIATLVTILTDNGKLLFVRGKIGVRWIGRCVHVFDVAFLTLTLVWDFLIDTVSDVKT